MISIDLQGFVVGRIEVQVAYDGGDVCPQLTVIGDNPKFTVGPLNLSVIEARELAAVLEFTAERAAAERAARDVA